MIDHTQIKEFYDHDIDRSIQFNADAEEEKSIIHQTEEVKFTDDELSCSPVKKAKVDPFSTLEARSTKERTSTSTTSPTPISDTSSTWTSISYNDLTENSELEVPNRENIQNNQIIPKKKIFNVITTQPRKKSKPSKCKNQDGNLIRYALSIIQLIIGHNLKLVNQKVKPKNNFDPPISPILPHYDNRLEFEGEMANSIEPFDEANRNNFLDLETSFLKLPIIECDKKEIQINILSIYDKIDIPKTIDFERKEAEVAKKIQTKRNQNSKTERYKKDKDLKKEIEGLTEMKEEIATIFEPAKLWFIDNIYNLYKQLKDFEIPKDFLKRYLPRKSFACIEEKKNKSKKKNQLSEQVTQKQEENLSWIIVLGMALKLIPESNEKLRYTLPLIENVSFMYYLAKSSCDPDTIQKMKSSDVRADLVRSFENTLNERCEKGKKNRIDYEKILTSIGLGYLRCKECQECKKSQECKAKKWQKIGKNNIDNYFK